MSRLASQQAHSMGARDVRLLSGCMSGKCSPSAPVPGPCRLLLGVLPPAALPLTDVSKPLAPSTSHHQSHAFQRAAAECVDCVQARCRAHSWSGNAHLASCQYACLVQLLAQMRPSQLGMYLGVKVGG